MTFFQKLVAIFTNTPRPTEDILEDMNQKANELRARAQFDQEQIEANEAEERRAQELAARNAVHAQSKERAERVAKRVEEFTA